MSLSGEDKKRIEEEEIYRAKVRAEVEKPKKKKGSGCLGIVIIGVLFIMYIGSKGKNSSSTRSTISNISSAKPTLSVGEVEKQVDATSDLAWHYGENEEEMGRGKVQYAGITSTNDFEFDFPYKGKQRAKLILRIHPKHGKDVVLKIERGQFLCSLDDCRVAVKFDEQKPKEISASGPADHNTTTLFIDGFSTFIGELKTAKKLLVEAPIFQEGNQIFEFDVTGFNWPAGETKLQKK